MGAPSHLTTGQRGAGALLRRLLPRLRGRPSPGRIAQKIGHFGEASIEEKANFACNFALIERDLHRAEPGVSHGLVDLDAAVTHPEPRVAVLLDVVLRASEPPDEEEGKAVARKAADAALGVEGVEASERGLLALHRVVKALYQGPDLARAAQQIKGNHRHL